MALKKIKCPQCGNVAFKEAGAIGRAKKCGSPIYCGRACSGVARRANKTKAQRVAEKRAYDMEYRRKNREILKAKKRAYFEATYDPVKAAIERKKTMARHVEYCRRPEYKQKKRVYDRQYRAAEYGEFSEAYMLLLDLDNEVNSRMSDYDVRIANGTINKRLKRKREYENLISGKP